MDSSLLVENHTELNIEKLKKILKEKYQIDVPSQCDKFLCRCLRQKDGNFEKAAKLAQAFHQVISDIGDWAAKLDPKCYDTNCYKLPILGPLAARDNLGRRVVVGQAKMWNPDKISFEETITAFWMMSQIAAINEEDQKHGCVAIWNLETLSLKQAFAISHRTTLRVFKWTNGGLMGRVKSAHIVNHPKIVGLAYQGIKPFVSEKIKKRIKFHKNLSDLHESLELERTSLPKFLGGDSEDYVDQEFMKKLLNSTEFFQEMLKNGLPTE